MSQVIKRDTGWKYLPDTVSCPEKPQCICETQGFDACEKAIDDYHNAVREASRHLVDIAEEDWEKVTFVVVNRSPESKLIRGKNDITFRAKPDTVYSIDAEFEVKMECHGSPIAYDPELNGPNDEPDDLKYRQIARLVN